MSATKFHVGDRVEDKKTHKRGRVTFVYSNLERKGEVIEVLFDGRDEAVDVSVDSVRGSVGGPTVNFSPRPHSPPSW